jgi:hypothetical protein
MSSRIKAYVLLNKTKSKTKSKTKKMLGYIYYTGIGAKKSGKHTKQEFLNIMNKTRLNESCPSWLGKKNYKPCSIYESMDSKMMQYAIKHDKPYGYNNRSCKSHNKYKREMNKCIKYLKNNKNKCKLDDYIDYSGAVYE